MSHPNLTIILGSCKSESGKNDNYTLNISPIGGHINKLNDSNLEDNIIKSIELNILNLYGYFPLSTGINSNKVLDKIIELSKNKFKIKIINRICGSCFRSLRYLIAKSDNIKYIVDPEQGLDKIMDSDEIRKCFRPSNI